MWVESLDNGRYKFFERYTDKYSQKYKKVSITLTSDSNRAKNEAQRVLNKKIEDRLRKTNTTEKRYFELKKEFWQWYPNTVKPKTAFRHKINQKIIDSHIGKDYLVSQLDRPFFESILEKIYYEDKYSYSVVKQCRSLLSVMMEYALKNNYVKINNVQNIKIVKKPTKLEDIEKIENKYLTHQELKDLFKALNDKKYSRNKRYADLAEFLTRTGLRIGEAISLKEENYKRDYIEIDGTLDYTTKKNSEGDKETTKTNASTRKVYLDNRSKQILDTLILENELMELNKKFNYKNFIFCSVYGNPIDLLNFNRKVQEVAKKIGIKKHITSHIFRHTHITILAELGINLKTIMDRVGHVKPETTLQIYSHVTKKMETDLIDKLNHFNL